LLFLLFGASCSGKTTILEELRRRETRPRDPTTTTAWESESQTRVASAETTDYEEHTVSVWGAITISLLSAGGGVAGGFFLERLRQRHLDATRWHPARRRLYVAFLEACEKWQVAVMDTLFSSIGMIRDGREPSDSEDGPATRHELDRLVEEIDLVATPSVRAAIQRTFEGLTDFGLVMLRLPVAVPQGPEVGAPAFAAIGEALQSYSQARLDLKREIRRDFGLGAD
jgi:hypothetical protein